MNHFIETLACCWAFYCGTTRRVDSWGWTCFGVSIAATAMLLLDHLLGSSFDGLSQAIVLFAAAGAVVRHLECLIKGESIAEGPSIFNRPDAWKIWEGAKHIVYAFLIVGGSLGALFVIGVAAQNWPPPH
jgi:hypothetical protein